MFLLLLRTIPVAGGMLSAFATRMTGSQDLFAARWDGGLPGGLAAGRRPAFGINALEPPLAASLLQLVGAAEDIERAEVVAKSALLAVLVAQVGIGTLLFHAHNYTALPGGHCCSWWGQQRT
jgi:hypothetical protein